ncbi:hypothetical protein G3N55_00060 [Dissulfurirhabdus thermomarina]|uniref:Mu-like prophage protein gp46 n=1 Tax=Dissulfurirhabdus thermomarina TaxID=1765737 RepID=A0A6N9TME2_DISTH|nr:phage GP46 family protein [Dissulfurirhabdus thermomarina]NDY41243.1 hypothetical protein [Dissulfurirhabdus thermomarina]
MDVRLDWDGISSDLVAEAGSLRTTDDLDAAVLVSLFSDRRADDDDVTRDMLEERRGWWGDTYALVPGDRIGSRIWLLAREKLSRDTLARAREYAAEALAWLVEDGLARRVDVEVERGGPGRLDILVRVDVGAEARLYRYRLATEEE